MNKLEKFIYEYLKHHPSLKMRIRNFYMDLMDIIPDDPSTFDGKLICKEGFFFGFHDHSPFSDKDLYILSNKLEIPLRMPKITDHLSVGYWDSSISNYANIAKSYAWNYHKGCRLQWLNSKNLTFIFNNAVDNKLVSQIRDVFDTTHVTVDYPIDSTSPNGKLATSFSYERLEHLMPGYGYQYNDEAFLDDKSPTKTGLFIIDLEKNKRSLICSLNQLANLDINSTMERARHYVTHTLFSPNSKQIAFLHRWIHNDVAKRYSRLIMCNIDGTDIKIFPTNGMVSHFVWDEKNGILAYCRINNIDGHYLFKDSSLINYKGIAVDTLNSDGHQHFIPNTRLFVTDTYPNRRRYAKLFLVDITTEKATQIANVKSLKKYQTRHPLRHWACDLHPRVNEKGDVICFDSVHTSNRSLCFLKLNDL